MEKKKQKEEVGKMMADGLLTEKDKAEVKNWGSKKKARFNYLVISGSSMADAFKAVEFNKGELDVELH